MHPAPNPGGRLPLAPFAIALHALASPAPARHVGILRDRAWRGLMKKMSIRTPEAAPFGQTLFDASVRATVLASLVKSPVGGLVDVVLTVALQRRLRRSATILRDRGMHASRDQSTRTWPSRPISPNGGCSPAARARIVGRPRCAKTSRLTRRRRASRATYSTAA